MEQKERFELHKEDKRYFIEIYDKEDDEWITADSVCGILNLLDRKLKIHQKGCMEYEDKIKQLESQIEQMSKDYTSENAFWTGASDKQLAISELEALAKFSEENAYYYEEEQFAKQINKYISEKIKSLKG